MFSIKKLFLSDLLVILILEFTYPLKLYALQPVRVFNGIENKLKPASNSADFYVLEKSDWTAYKEDIKSDSLKIIKTQDSLLTIIQEQSNLLINLKNPTVELDKEDGEDIFLSALPWAICVVLGIIILIGIVHFFNTKTKISDAMDQYQNLTQRYEELKRNWIDRERLLKREMIDLKNKMEEFQKN
jgi:hypothetical protein